MSRKTQAPFWDPDVLQSLLATKVLGRNLVVFNQITSTNDFLKRITRRGTPAGTLVLADKQTSGRGRLGRTWDSPAGKGLWFSFLMRPQLSPEKLGLVSLAVAAIVAETLSSLCGRELQVKWPNDVLYGEKKLCGILCESQISTEGVDAIVAGIGVNVLQKSEDFSDDLRDRALSLAMVAGSALDRKQVLNQLLIALEHELFGDLDQNLPRLIERWCSYCHDLGSQILVAIGGPEPAGAITFGTMEGIGEGGELMLRLPSGKLRLFSAGEITIVRDRT